MKTLLAVVMAFVLSATFVSAQTTPGKPAAVVIDKEAEAEATKYVQGLGGRVVPDANFREAIISVVFEGVSVKTVDLGKLEKLGHLKYLSLERTTDTNVVLGQL